MTALPKGEPRVCAPLYRRIPRRREAVRPYNTTVYRTCALSLPCHSEPVTDVTGVGIRPPRPQAELLSPEDVRQEFAAHCRTTLSLYQ